MGPRVREGDGEFVILAGAGIHGLGVNTGLPPSVVCMTRVSAPT